MTRDLPASSHGNPRAYPEVALWRRFWESASGFWRGRSAWFAWSISILLVVIVLLQLYVQYRLNFWNRDFFNALEQRDSAMLRYQAMLFFPLATASIVLAIASVWGRMTTQRKWREWLTTHLINSWIAEKRYARLVNIEANHQIPEYRIAEDARVATDAPIDFALGLLSALLTAAIFIQVLWNIGDGFDGSIIGLPIWIPNYLVIAVIVYSVLVTVGMRIVGSHLTDIIQNKNQAEAELITAAHQVREAGEQQASGASEDQARNELWKALRNTLAQWRALCWQLMGTTLISHGNFLLAPIIGLVLCAPKFLAGTMTLGELTQAAAAFTMVQSSFNWFVDNYQRIADWVSSVDRVGTLLLTIDQIEGVAGAESADVTAAEI